MHVSTSHRKVHASTNLATGKCDYPLPIYATQCHKKAVEKPLLFPKENWYSEIKH